MRVALCESAWATSRTRNTYLAAKFWKLAGKKGKKRTVFAIAHKIAVIAYHILTTKQPYQELGHDYLSTLDTTKYERKLVKKLSQLGCSVTKAPAAATQAS